MKTKLWFCLVYITLIVSLYHNHKQADIIAFYQRQTQDYRRDYRELEDAIKNYTAQLDSFWEGSSDGEWTIEANVVIRDKPFAPFDFNTRPDR